MTYRHDKRARIAATALLAMLTVSAGAAAQENWNLQTGNDYLATCSTAIEGVHVNDVLCLGYMKGALALLTSTQLLYDAVRKQSAVVCIPNNVSMGQLMRISLKFLNDNPNDLHRP